MVAEARTAREAYAVVDETQPTLVVLDVSLGPSDGVAVARELMRRRAACHILMLTMHAVPDCVVRSLQAGALGYALKDEPADATLRAVRTTAAGARYLSPRLPVAEIEAQLLGRRSVPPEAAVPLDRLSRRERELFAMIVRGLPIARSPPSSASASRPSNPPGAHQPQARCALRRRAGPPRALYGVVEA